LRTLAAVRRGSGLRRHPRAVIGGAVAVLALVSLFVVNLLMFGPREPESARTGTGGQAGTGGLGVDLETDSRLGPPPSGHGDWPPPGRRPPPRNNQARPGGPPARAVVSDLATITSPENGAKASRCTTVRGTSDLRRGQTLLLSVDNLDMGDGLRHLQLVPGWQEPAKLDTWHGLQFIGLPEDPVGGHFRIEVLVVPLAGLERQIAAGAAGPRGWPHLVPPGSVVAASVLVTRQGADESLDTCPAPPR
jgi:hypothetical protein